MHYYCYYYNHPGSSDGLLVLCLCLSVCFCVFLCSRVNDIMFKCLEPASVKRLVGCPSVRLSGGASGGRAWPVAPECHN